MGLVLGPCYCPEASACDSFDLHILVSSGLSQASLSSIRWLKDSWICVCLSSGNGITENSSISSDSGTKRPRLRLRSPGR